MYLVHDISNYHVVPLYLFHKYILHINVFISRFVSIYAVFQSNKEKLFEQNIFRTGNVVLTQSVACFTFIVSILIHK